MDGGEMTLDLLDFSLQVADINPFSEDVAVLDTMNQNPRIEEMVWHLVGDAMSDLETVDWGALDVLLGEIRKEVAIKFELQVGGRNVDAASWLRQKMPRIVARNRRLAAACT